MSRVIAIDHGIRRTGVAVTDPLRMIASALDTVETAQIIDFLRKYVAREDVEGFVVGLPTGLCGQATDGTAGAQVFITQLKAAFPDKWVEAVDERFTSRMAERTLRESGRGRIARRDKGALDRISATILLQDWLQRNG